MILFKKSVEIAEYSKGAKASKKKIGFVPTMGALHKGHLSLLEVSKQNNDLTACSIFINPTQFNDLEDFRKYPVTIENDIYQLERAGASLLFLPEVTDMYPDGTGQALPYDLGSLENILEGKYRPGHFQGVCQVMNRLLDIIQPHHLYLGQKDYQQCMIVKRLLEIIHSDIILITCPTLREPDGLAMSSRNTRLDVAARSKARHIYLVLTYLKENIKPGNVDDLIKAGIRMLEENEFKTDYLAIADAATLEEVHYWNGSQKLVALAAAFIHEVRLIDNMFLTGDGPTAVHIR